MKITLEDIKKNPTVRIYILSADESLTALGYTEHSFSHVTKTAAEAARILRETGRPEHEGELASIAGYLHDIGNMINRSGHAQSGAVMAFVLLSGMDADPEDIAAVITAIGNHDEGTAFPVSDIAAALILADKTDVRRTRVRDQNQKDLQGDIHDRVNYAVSASSVQIDAERKDISLNLDIDTDVSTVTDYFEIFLSRMLLCRRAAERLGMKFSLAINGQKMM